MLKWEDPFNLSESVELCQKKSSGHDFPPKECYENFSDDESLHNERPIVK